MVHVEPQHVSITIHTKRGRQEGKVIVGETPRPRKIPRPRMSVCSTSGGSVTSQRAGASICARSPTAFMLKSSAQCVHFQSFYLLCQVPRGSVEEVSSKPPPDLASSNTSFRLLSTVQAPTTSLRRKNQPYNEGNGCSLNQLTCHRH